MDSKKNILLLIPTFAVSGGAQRMVGELGRVLSERHNVIECSFNAFEETRAFQTGNRVLSLGVEAPTNRMQKLVGYALRAYYLNRLKSRHSIDITISNLWPADFINVLSMGRGKRVSIAHIGVIGNQENQPMLKFRKATGWFYRRFEKVVAVNEYLMDELTQLFELPPSRRTHIPNFVTMPDAVHESPVLFPKRKRVAWVGRLHPVKNLAPFLTIFAGVKKRLHDAQLVVIGEGPERAELTVTARATGLRVSDNANDPQADVVFLGFDDPYPYLRASDLFVLTSRSEGFGLVIVEAMSVGLPILAADCPTGGPHSIMEGNQPFQPGRTAAEATPYGYLMPVPESGNSSIGTIWEDAIVEFLTDEAKRMGIAADCKLRSAAYSEARIKQQWFELLESMRP
jgi:glycosyltransferase involved in cell wall biosynthesis